MLHIHRVNETNTPCPFNLFITTLPMSLLLIVGKHLEYLKPYNGYTNLVSIFIEGVATIT